MSKIIDLEKHKKKPKKGEAYFMRKVLAKYSDMRSLIGRQLGEVRYLGEPDENKKGEDASKKFLSEGDLRDAYRSLGKIIKDLQENLGGR